MLEKNRAEATPRERDSGTTTRQRSRRRRLPWKRLLALVVIAGLGAYAWYSFNQPKEIAAPATVAVTRGDIQQTVLASGSLQANSVVSVGAQVSGPIQKLFVKVGDAVKTGDPIAQIDSTQQENAVKSSEAALANVKAQLVAQQASLEQAQAALKRSKDLAGRNLVSQADLQTAQANYDMASAKIDQIQAQITQAELAVSTANLNLSETRIVAPSAGTIVAVLVPQGQQVSAQQSSPTIAKIADLDTMVIDAQISEADVTKVKPGQRVYFTILGEPNTKIDATLRAINPAPQAIDTNDTGISSSDSAVYYDGLFEVPNPDHKLRIAMTAQVTIVLKDAPNALLVPASALQGTGRNGEYMVSTYDPQTREISHKRIKVGIDNNVMASIESGLTEGELVVTSDRGAAGSASSRQNGSSSLSRFRPPGGGALGL